MDTHAEELKGGKAPAADLENTCPHAALSIASLWLVACGCGASCIPSLACYSAHDVVIIHGKVHWPKDDDGRDEERQGAVQAYETESCT